MYRYPDGTFRQSPPTTVDYQGVVRRFADLTREESSAAGYNEAVPATRQPFTAYETKWSLGEDLIYREEIVSSETDETARSEHEATLIRVERDRLLAECDWTQLTDNALTEVDKAAWGLYRASLRDVPQQAGFPDSVSWPEAPA